MTGNTHPNPLPIIVRAFLARTRIAQEDLSKQSEVSLATINNIVRAKPDKRFSDETETKVRAAIERLLEEEGAGGWETVVEVKHLAEDVEDLRAKMAELIETVQGIARDIKRR